MRYQWCSPGNHIKTVETTVYMQSQRLHLYKLIHYELTLCCVCARGGASSPKKELWYPFQALDFHTLAITLCTIQRKASCGLKSMLTKLASGSLSSRVEILLSSVSVLSVVYNRRVFCFHCQIMELLFRISFWISQDGHVAQPFHIAIVPDFNQNSGYCLYRVSHISPVFVRGFLWVSIHLPKTCQYTDF